MFGVLHVKSLITKKLDLKQILTNSELELHNVMCSGVEYT